MGLDDDLDPESPGYGDSPKDADDFPGGQAGPADLSESSGDPDDDPATENLADATARAETPGDLVLSSKGEFADHDNDGLPDAAFYDYAGEPVPDVPAPVTPDTPTDEAQRRVSYERLVNEQWDTFIRNNHEAFIDHALAGRDPRLVGYNADGSQYDLADDIGDPDAEQSHRSGPHDGEVIAAADHDAVVAADPDSTDLRSETDNPKLPTDR